MLTTALEREPARPQIAAIVVAVSAVTGCVRASRPLNSTIRGAPYAERRKTRALRRARDDLD
jgi:hypothetical protein